LIEPYYFRPPLPQSRLKDFSNESMGLYG